MKREFLGIVVLLAGGIILGQSFFRSAVNASAQETALQLTPRIAHVGTAAGNASPTAVNDSINSESAHLLVRTAAASLANSPPLEARLRYKIDMFGQRISGPGRYFQAGQGSRKTRIEFEFGFNEMAVQLHQFCDGDMLYSLTTAGQNSSLEFVDLRRLDALQKSMPSSDRVMTWLSVGSLTGLLDQLAEHFEFSMAEPGQLDAIPVINCTGKWRAVAVRKLLNGQIDSGTVVGDVVDWQKLPKHLPHQVQLTLGNDQRFPYFPYRIVFEQFEIHDGVQVAVPIAVLELYELKHAPRLSDDMFRLPSVDTPPIDATDFYEHRIRQFAR